MYDPVRRAVWVAKLPQSGARLRAQTLYAQLDVLQAQRKKAKAAMVTESTRGLNRYHNRVLKNVFKGAATSAIGKPGPLQDLYHGMIERGMRKELARVTLARKLAALTLRLLKTGEVFDPRELTRPQTWRGFIVPELRVQPWPSGPLERRIPGRRCGRQSQL